MISYLCSWNGYSDDLQVVGYTSGHLIASGSFRPAIFRSFKCEEICILHIYILLGNEVPFNYTFSLHPNYPTITIRNLEVLQKAPITFWLFLQLLPEKYNYRRAVPAQHDDIIECVICMNTVDISEGTHMVTPCEHIFHGECLETWLDQKLECPTCRRTLPLP